MYTLVPKAYNLPYLYPKIMKQKLKICRLQQKVESGFFLAIYNQTPPPPRPTTQPNWYLAFRSSHKSCDRNAGINMSEGGGLNAQFKSITQHIHILPNENFFLAATFSGGYKDH